MKEVLIEKAAYLTIEVVEALHDERVLTALNRALRDQRIRRRVDHLRRQGKTVDDAVWIVAEEMGLSDEHIRTIYYDKKRRRGGQKNRAEVV
ncbi:MAG: hypothetical protein AAGJ10_16680 [Bacteroidota bacterium]